MWCDHYNRHGHTSDICWKIHGKPANWVPQRQTEGHACQTQSNQDNEATTENQASILFSKEQIKQLCRLLNQSPAPSSSTPSLGLCYVAQSGNYHSALKSTIHFKEPWIIDSGASDHMAGVSNFFLSYTPCPSSTIVKITD